METAVKADRKQTVFTQRIKASRTKSSSKRLRHVESNSARAWCTDHGACDLSRYTEMLRHISVERRTSNADLAGLNPSSTGLNLEGSETVSETVEVTVARPFRKQWRLSGFDSNQACPKDFLVIP
ncbi:hypothetical protein RRG08_050300 [Elysia crispata]|uniref:Uncharacterized protein n=1 Tax=Elysia crispata TaxID=231223 RepID=A0AAE1A0E3_9GAST|nr:hypothetical protein RRG08_050300 [Elysia crispata]